MASRFLVPPSPQDRAPAPIHALHSPYHLASIRLVPYDYPTNATTTTKCHEQVEQEGSIRKIACDAEPLSRPCSYSTRGSTQGSERSPGRPWSRGGRARRSSCSRSPGGHRTQCWVDDRGQPDSAAKTQIAARFSPSLMSTEDERGRGCLP